MLKQMLNEKINLLINERSPKLLKDTDNPSDCCHWETSSFSNEKAEVKPVFLNIGNVATNWFNSKQ